MSDTLATKRHAILAELVREANAGERLSDSVRVVDLLEGLAADRSYVPRGLGEAAGVTPRPPEAAVHVADIATKLLRHLRGEQPWRAFQLEKDQ